MVTPGRASTEQQLSTEEISTEKKLSESSNHGFAEMLPTGASLEYVKQPSITTQSSLLEHESEHARIQTDEISEICGLTMSQLRRRLSILSKVQLLEVAAFGMFTNHELFAAGDSILESDPASRRVMIRGLSFHTTTASFREYFSSFGPLENSAVIRFPDGRSQGYGFLIYKKREFADKVVNTQHILNDRMLTAKLAADTYTEFGKDEEGNSMQSERRKLFIRNICSEITRDLLEDAFRPYGEVEECAIIRSGGTGSRAYGFVTFKNPADALRAAQMPFRVLNGWVVFVTFSTGKVWRQQRSEGGLRHYSNRGNELGTQQIYGEQHDDGLYRNKLFSSIVSPPNKLPTQQRRLSAPVERHAEGEERVGGYQQQQYYHQLLPLQFNDVPPPPPPPTDSSSSSNSSRRAFPTDAKSRQQLENVEVVKSWTSHNREAISSFKELSNDDRISYPWNEDSLMSDCREQQLGDNVDAHWDMWRGSRCTDGESSDRQMSGRENFPQNSSSPLFNDGHFNHVDCTNLSLFSSPEATGDCPLSQEKQTLHEIAAAPELFSEEEGEPEKLHSSTDISDIAGWKSATHDSHALLPSLSFLDGLLKERPYTAAQ